MLNSNKKSKIGAVVAVTMALFMAGSSLAALLGVLAGIPRISLPSQGTTNYVPALLGPTGLLSINGLPGILFTVPPPGLPVFPIIPAGAAGESFDIVIEVVQATGALATTTATDLDIFGEVDLTPIGKGIQSGTLLTGEAQAFGFQDTGVDAVYDFAFTVTGGLLSAPAVGLFPVGSAVNAIVTSENSSFNDDFTVAFSGGAKGNAGAGPPSECVLELDKTCCIPEPPKPPGGGSCDEIKKIETVDLIWNGPDDVDVELLDKDKNVVQTILDVDNGEPVTLNVAGLGNDAKVNISGALTGESKFHVSCSDSAMNGTEDCGSAQGDGKKNESKYLNLWLFDGFGGEKGDLACTVAPDPDPLFADECVTFDGLVEYQYKVTNPNTGAVIVTVEDDVDVSDAVPPIVIDSGIEVDPNGGMVTLFDTRTISDTTTNEATVTGVLKDGGQVCTDATDRVTVELVEPPPAPFNCMDAKPIQKLSVKWTDLGPVDVELLDKEENVVQTISPVNSGQVVVLNVAGLGNDPLVKISGVVTGESKFHVSCSDNDMNDENDCGSAQGNGKKNESEFLNLWTFEGMEGANGDLVCP